MKLLTLIIALLAFQNTAHAIQTNQTPPPSVFAEGLKLGKSDISLPPIPQIQSIAGELKRRSGNSGEIKLSVRSLFRYKQQPKCGRIIFFLSQPSTSTAWIDTGGQINICEDGSPPLRTCRGTPSMLIAPDARCPDGSQPIDTAEISNAIAQAATKKIIDQPGVHK